MASLMSDGEPRAALDLLDEGARRALAAARGPEPAGEAPDLLTQLRRQVARRPLHTAVEASDGVLGYAELDRLVGRFARRLRALGVRPESRVAIALPRGARELVAMLGTLRAGAAYVPLDPSHPAERLRLVLQDTAPEVLVTLGGSPLLATLPPATRSLPFDHLEGLATSAADERDERDEPVSPDQLAYVLFTSGSTGRPKGVEISRAAFANFLRAMVRRPGLAESDRLLAITTTTFDIAGLEHFLPLCVGATVVIADRETSMDPRRLGDRLARAGITVLQATPATWRMLLGSGWRGDGRLRMLCGGEALDLELARELLGQGSELWNLYGPTETTVWSTAQRIEATVDRISIGRPIDHTQIYLLDEQRRLVAPGVVAEIYIGGRGLARGYRGRPELTGERFVPDPFGAPGERLYRTGDLGRMLQDGRFECLGRVDHQVKIRGHRVELGEIESVLRRGPGVAEVLVAAEPPTEGTDPELCAYWVGEASREVLHERARAHLPVYLVPSRYVKLAGFPLSSNGKVDRRALRSAAAGGDPAHELRGPRSPAESKMAAIWREVLGISAVGVDQDFFALGGTSARVLELRARAERAFGVELPLRAFFETPTIERLVESLGRPDHPDAPIVVTLRRGAPGAPPLHCVRGIEAYQDLALALEDDRPVLGIHVPTRYSPRGDAPRIIVDLGSRYAEAIRRHQPEGPYHLAGMSFGGLIAYEAARQLEAAGHRVAVVAVLDTVLPSAERPSRRARVQQLARRLLASPSALPGMLRNDLARRRARLRASVAKLLTWQAGRPVTAEDREVEATRGYEKRMGRLHGRLLVFRATGAHVPEWVSIAPDLGWGSWASQVDVHDVASDHLDIVRAPHVFQVARVLGAALRASGT
jgi:amino acid adenylation domain-containing protein